MTSEQKDNKVSQTENVNEELDRYVNFSIFKVQKGHERSNHGHERSYGKAQKKNVVTNDILGCSAFF